MVLFNIIFPHQPPALNQTYREDKYLGFSIRKGFTGITMLPIMRIYPQKYRFSKMYWFMWIFKIFSYFCLWKNRNKMRAYIIWTSNRNFSWNFPTFQKPPSVYNFINCTNLWKFVSRFSTPIWISSNYQTRL